MSPYPKPKDVALAGHPRYRRDIDGLRALAVLAVVGFHAFPSTLSGGFIGVDIFFVISGYLISRIIYGQLHLSSFRFLAFYARRILRIFPALLVVITSCLAFGWFALLADEYKQLGKHILGGATFVSNFLLWKESGYFDNAAETKPLLHLWSLGIEEQFYLGWPLVVWLAWRQRLGLLATSLVLASLSFLLNIATFRIDSIATFYLPQTRIWELLCGSLLAHFHTSRSLQAEVAAPAIGYDARRWCAAALNSLHFITSDNSRSFIGAILVTVGLLTISNRSPFPGFLALLPAVGTVLILSASERAWLNRKVLSRNLLVWIGLISFPLYLWHWPILSFLRIIASDTPSLTVRIAAVLAALLLAHLTYVWIEKPIRCSKSLYPKVGLLCGLMMVACLSGYLVYRGDGVASRPAVKSFKQNQSQLLRTAEIDDACLAYIGDGRPRFPYCRYTNAGGKHTVAVIGDSHAHTAYDGIAEALAESGVNTVLFANSGCPPFMGAEYGASAREKETCKLQVEQILRTVAEKVDIKDVLIFSRGPAYVTSRQTPVVNGKDIGKPLITLTVFGTSLQNTAAMLQRAGKSVAYVTENPELLASPRSCLPRPLQWVKNSCDVSLDRVMNRQENYLALLSQLNGVKVINSLSGFCPNGTCHAFDSGENLLYVDDNHLSVAGSLFQAHIVLRDTLDAIKKQ